KLIEGRPEGLVWYAVPAAGDAPGVKVAAHILGRPVDPRDGPFTEINPALEEEAAGYVHDRLPGLDPAGLGAETCLYTMTPDEDFVLDRAGPLVVGGGCSGHAFKFGPLLGEFLADLALGQDIPVPRERFALRRPSLAASWLGAHLPQAGCTGLDAGLASPVRAPCPRGYTAAGDGQVRQHPHPAAADAALAGLRPRAVRRHERRP